MSATAPGRNGARGRRELPGGRHRPPLPGPDPLPPPRPGGAGRALSPGAPVAAGNFLLRAAPSAGALYPVETYLAAHRVEGLTPGIWHFQVPAVSLELIAPGDCRRELVAAGLDQEFLGTAGAVFIWTGVLNPSMWN